MSSTHSEGLPAASWQLLCKEATFAVLLQYRRLQSCHPDVADYDTHWRTEFRFLLKALCHLRNLAEQAARLPDIAPALEPALREFDRQVPALRELQGALAYADNYAAQRSTDLPHVLFGSVWNGKAFLWLGIELNVDAALAACLELSAALPAAS